MSAFWNWIKSEPVVITQVIGALVTLAAAFGLNLTPDQSKAIMGMGIVAVALISRQYVTANTKVDAKIDAAVAAVQPPAPIINITHS